MPHTPSPFLFHSEAIYTITGGVTPPVPDPDSDRESSDIDHEGSSSREEQTLAQNTNSKGNSALMVILTGGTLSCVTTLFAEGDVLSNFLALFYQGESVAASVVTNYVIPGMTTVPINGVLRGVNFDRAKDKIVLFFSEQKSCGRLLEGIRYSLPYLVPAILTAGVDVYIGVYTSSSARALLSPLALKIETILSFFYMLPIDFLGLYDLSGRFQRFREKVRGMDNRQQAYERAIAVYAFLKNLTPAEQEEALREIIGYHDRSSLQTESVIVPSPENVKMMPREEFDGLAKAICEDRNLNDGSSMLSQIVTPISLTLAAMGGAATLYSPVENVYLKHSVPASVAWPLGTVSGATKGAFYAVSYDNLFRFWRLGSQLFPSRLARVGIPLIASVAGLGFWEVGSHAVKGYASMAYPEDVTSTGMMPWYAEDPDSRGIEEPPVWFYAAVGAILLSGCVANISACFNLLLRIMEKNRQAKTGLDYAAAFLGRANEIITTAEKREPARVSQSSFEQDDEERRLVDTVVPAYSDTDTRSATGNGSAISTGEPSRLLSRGSSCFFQDSQPRRTFGITGYLERSLGRVLGFNF